MQLTRYGLGAALAFVVLIVSYPVTRADEPTPRNRHPAESGRSTTSGQPRLWTSRNPAPVLPSVDDYRKFAGAGVSDFDSDGIDDAVDNCVFTPNNPQADADLDGIGDACDSCPAAAEPRPPLLVEAFGLTAPGWTHTSLGGADTWHLDNNACFEVSLGSTMYVANGNAGPLCVVDSTYEYSKLVGPPVTLPAAGTITLSFDAVAYDEIGSCLTSGDWDKKDVGLSTDGGQTYTRLNDCFALVTSTGVLTHHDFDIGAFAGQTVQVVFAYDTLDDLNQDSFAVDNVTITSNGAPEKDTDLDLVGDICDACPFDGQNDIDGDGQCADVDNCPDDFNPPAPAEQENYETGAPGWTHGVRGADGVCAQNSMTTCTDNVPCEALNPGDVCIFPVDTWHLDTSNCFAVPLSSTAYVANGNAGPTCTPGSAFERSQLLSPVYNLPAGVQIVLDFDAVSFDELGRCLSSEDFDAKDVGITIDGGASYALLNSACDMASRLTTSSGVVKHHQYDISAFAGQSVQVIFVYNTRDADNLHTFAVDNLLVKPLQPDDDGDLRGNPCDCLPADPAYWDAPGRIRDLVFTDSTTMQWNPVTEDSAADAYQVMRGSVTQFPVGSGAAETCEGLNLPAATFFDTDPVTGGFYYLARGTNVCGAGSYGLQSPATDRTSAVCP